MWRRSLREAVKAFTPEESMFLDRTTAGENPARHTNQRI